MKIRKGFVSNSSSSSFVIAVAPDCNIKDELEKYKVDGKNPFTKIGNDIIDWFSEGSFTDIRDDIDIDDEDSMEWVGKDVMVAIDKGWDVRTGSASDDCYGEIENIICDMDINIKTDTLLIEKEGKY